MKKEIKIALIILGIVLFFVGIIGGIVVSFNNEKNGENYITDYEYLYDKISSLRQKLDDTENYLRKRINRLEKENYNFKLQFFKDIYDYQKYKGKHFVFNEEFFSDKCLHPNELGFELFSKYFINNFIFHYLFTSCIIINTNLKFLFNKSNPRAIITEKKGVSIWLN